MKTTRNNITEVNMCAKKVTMHDIAKAADVSQSTVSLILNGKSASFPPATIEKVLSTAASMHYSLPQTSPSFGGRTVLVITVQLTNPYYAAMQQGIDRAAFPHAINVITSCSYHDPVLEESFLQMAIAKNLLGIIFLYPPDNREAFDKARKQIPIVTICDRANGIPGDTVELNNFEAGVLIARHLIGLGHTKIAVLSHSSDRIATSRATRVAGILSEIRRVLPEEQLLMLSGNNNQSRYLKENSLHYYIGYSLAQNQKLYQNDITGLICVNDLLAYGVMDALAEKGYRIPEDFSVVGSDNLLFSGMSRISLTTVELHPDVVSETALATLLNRIQMRSSLTTTSFQAMCMPALIPRGSTGAARTTPLPMARNAQNNENL